MIYAASPTESLSVRSHALLDGARHLWQQVVLAAPRVLFAIALFLVLWLVAIIVRAAVRRLVALTKLDDVIDKTRLGGVLKAMNPDLTASKAVGKLAYYAVLLVALTTVADMLGLGAVGKVLSAVLGYLPKLVSAILIVAAGGYFASFVSQGVLGVLKQMRSPYARPLAGIAEGAILVVVFTIAVDNLGVDLSFITSNITLIVSVATVTLCFLFAWSMRRPAEEIVANFYLRRMVNVGDQVSMGDTSGTVEKFAPIGLLVRDDSGDIQFVPAHHVLDGLRKKARRSKTPSAKKK